MATPYYSGSVIGLVAGRPFPIQRTPATFAWIKIRADLANTGIVCIGNETINASVSPVRGIWLVAGDTWEDENIDLSLIFCDFSVANEAFAFTCGNG